MLGHIVKSQCLILPIDVGEIAHIFISIHFGTFRVITLSGLSTTDFVSCLFAIFKQKFPSLIIIFVCVSRRMLMNFCVMCVERRLQVWCVITESVVRINPIRSQTEPRPLKVISDIDDTFRSSLKDYSFPSGTSMFKFVTAHYEFILIPLPFGVHVREIRVQ